MTPAVPDAVSTYLARMGVMGAEVRPLTPDASDRRYFRVRPKHAPSFVLAVLSGAFDSQTLPFINVAGLFGRMPVPIPRILGEAPDIGVLALEDLGDVTLQARLSAASAEERVALYREAVHLIGVIQRRGAELAEARYLPYGLAFDVEKLLWECRFFVTHFLEGHRHCSITPTDRAALDEEFTAIADELSAEPRVLCHRDYHSRNLMWHHDRLCIIDFQDARMGPDTYDVVSLLRDAYVDIPESLVVDLIEAFFDARSDPSRPRDRRARFDLMAVQRNIKALGTFGYQTTTRQNPVYIQYMPRTLRYARETMLKYPRFARLRGLLATHLEEFR